MVVVVVVVVVVVAAVVVVVVTLTSRDPSDVVNGTSHSTLPPTTRRLFSFCSSVISGCFSAAASAARVESVWHGLQHRSPW